MEMRNTLSSSLPQSNVPGVDRRIPKAAPLFSINRSWNQSGKTTIDSSSVMWVLTHILSAWSATSRMRTSREIFFQFMGLNVQFLQK